MEFEQSSKPEFKAVFTRYEEPLMLERIQMADAVFSSSGFTYHQNGVIRIFIRPPTRLHQARIHGCIQSVTFKGPWNYDTLKFQGPDDNPRFRDPRIPCPEYECREILVSVHTGHTNNIRIAIHVCKLVSTPSIDNQPCPSLGSLLQKDDATKDLSLVTADSKTLHVHKAVLMVHSDFFRKMNNFEEGKTASITVQESSSAWNSILRFAYERSVQMEPCHMLEVAEIAIKYQITDLIPLVWDFVLHNVKGDNAPSIFLFACLHEHIQLQYQCAGLVRINAKELISDPQWVDAHRTALMDPNFGSRWADALRGKALS